MTDQSDDWTILRMCAAFLVLGIISLTSYAVVASSDTTSRQSVAATQVPPTPAPTSIVAIVEKTTVPTTTSPPTTTTVARTTTTTQPPPPVYKLYEAEGVNARFNPCQNPITILFNPMTYLEEDQILMVEGFLIEQAAELSGLTGMQIVYGSRTNEVSESKFKNGEKILLHIGMPGEGILEAAGSGFGWTSSLSWDRTEGAFREIDAVQIQINAQYLSSFESWEFNTSGHDRLMEMLGASLGLAHLTDDDMTAAGSIDESRWSDEVMYGNASDTPTWGPGDRAGLAAVGAMNGCF